MFSVVALLCVLSHRNSVDTRLRTGSVDLGCTRDANILFVLLWAFPGGAECCNRGTCISRMELKSHSRYETGANSGPKAVHIVVYRGAGGGVDHCQVNLTLKHSVGIIPVYILSHTRHCRFYNSISLNKYLGPISEASLFMVEFIV